MKDVSGFHQLPVRGDIVFITSSLKDVMVLRELGYPAIAFSSEAIPTKGENAKFVRAVIDHLRSRFTRVVFFLDNDEAGITYSKILNKEYKIPYIVTPEKEPKDISDYYLKYGRRKTRQFLNKQIKKLIKNEITFEDIVKQNSSDLSIA